jgi:hypothetical protein
MIKGRDVLRYEVEGLRIQMRRLVDAEVTDATIAWPQRFEAMRGTHRTGGSPVGDDVLLRGVQSLGGSKFPERFASLFVHLMEYCMGHNLKAVAVSPFFLAFLFEDMPPEADDDPEALVRHLESKGCDWCVEKREKFVQLLDDVLPPDSEHRTNVTEICRWHLQPSF